MPKKESPEEFFARSCGKGSGIKSEIVNGKRVKKRSLTKNKEKLYLCLSIIGSVRVIF
jgi:hypothetical protein